MTTHKTEIQLLFRFFCPFSDTVAIAKKAAGQVKVTYQDNTPPIVDTREAVEKGYFHAMTVPDKVIGDTEGTFQEFQSGVRISRL